MHSTPVGAPSSSAMFGAPRTWHAISPSAPQPKSYQPRHWKGTYRVLNGRALEIPSQVSQSSVGGTGSSAGISVSPCAQIGRLVQACTSVTLPMAPDQIISEQTRGPSSQYPWLPI